MAIELSFAERRVLGVLVEKGFTTPDQYPLTLNGVVVGSNQKSCRDPLSFIDEEKALDSLESLRSKGFTVLVRSEGSRADRWKHRFGDALVLEAKEVAVLAELLLRGPQTDGELRQRAGRMRPIESLEEVEQILERLRARPEPLVEKLGPPARKRGVKYAHTFYPPAERPSDESSMSGSADAGSAEAAHATAAEAPVAADTGSSRAAAWAPPRAETSAPPPRPAPETAPDLGALLELRREIDSLRERVAELEATFVRLLK